MGCTPLLQYLGQLSFEILHPSWVAKSSPSFGWVNVTSAEWLVTLCDPIWHLSSRSGVARYTVYCYIRLL